MKVENNQDESKDKRPSLSLLQVISSVFAAGLGVQSSKNRERDFKTGSFKVFVISGIIFTLVFVGAVYAVVQMVLSSV